MSSIKSVLFAIVSCLLLQTAVADQLIVPTNVYLSPDSGVPIAGHGTIDALVDGSGFIESTTYKTGDQVPSVWNTVALHESGVGTDWLVVDSSGGKDPLALVFSLEKVFKVSGLVLWNYNADGAWARKGLQEIEVYVSADGGTNWTLADTLSPQKANGIKAEKAQVFSFSSGVHHANVIKLVGRSNDPIALQYGLGLDEILFIEEVLETEINATPSIPTPVNRTTAFSNSIAALSWQAPGDINIAKIKGYDVYFGLQTNVTANPVYSAASERLSVNLQSGKNYYWRVDTRVTNANGVEETLTGQLWTFRTLPERTANNLNPTPSWYVGDTTPGEWIEYKEVFLSEGHYRFTGHLGAETQGQSVSVSIDGGTLGDIVVPATGGYENFELVHLGSQYFKEGRYTIRLTFDTGMVSADMIYIRKSADTFEAVVDDDIAVPPPSKIDGTAVTPISSRTIRGKWPFGDDDYTDEQNIAWYKQRMYTPMLNDDLLYSKLDEQVAARIDFAWLEGMGTNVERLDEWDWGYDRDYIVENGDNGAGKSQRFFETLNEHPFAGYLQFGYFVGNAIYGDTYYAATNDTAEWDSKAFQQWIWEHWTKPWFDAIPQERLYIEDNHVLVNFATPYCNCGNNNGIADFMADFKARIREEYGYETHIILAQAFLEEDPKLLDMAYTIQPWLTWDTNDSHKFTTLNGVTTGVINNGRRLPLNQVWEGDWDPYLNSGTRQGQQYDDDGNYLSTRSNGHADYAQGLEQANESGAKWALLDRWGEPTEGSMWSRTEHHDNNYPNEFINITREYADKETAVVLLQAEGADYYYDSTPGNSGGAYRYYWHEGRESDLDVFRPRRRLHGFTLYENAPQGLKALSGGDFDVWAVDELGRPYATEKDGDTQWQAAVSDDVDKKNLTFEQIEVGQQGWGIVNGKLYRSAFYIGAKPWENKHWELMDERETFVDLSLNVYQNQVWAVDSDNHVWVGHQIDGQLTQVTGANLIDVAAGEDWVWGITTNGELVRRGIRHGDMWETIPSDRRFTSLTAGSGEIWGITQNGDVYRNSEHGKGQWELIASYVTSVGLSSEFVWLLKSDGSVLWSKMTGFEEIKSY